MDFAFQDVELDHLAYNWIYAFSVALFLVSNSDLYKTLNSITVNYLTFNAFSGLFRVCVYYLLQFCLCCALIAHAPAKLVYAIANRLAFFFSLHSTCFTTHLIILFHSLCGSQITINNKINKLEVEFRQMKDSFLMQCK